MTAPPTADAPPSPRRWPVMMVGWLLFLQAAGLFGLGGTYFLSLVVPARFDPEVVLLNATAALTSGAFNMLAFMALLAGIGFFRVYRLAWLYAMAVQGLALLLALSLYMRSRPAFAYLIMLYGIFMVIYLNFSEVQAAFRPKPALPQEGEGQDQ